MKIMKNKIHSARHLALKATAAFAVFTTACASLGGFSRGTAATAIENDGRYLTPAAMTIDIGWKLTNANAKVNQISADETAEAAALRAREDFMLRHPQLIVAEELGYIKLRFDKPELKEAGAGNENYKTNLGVWTFDPRAEITDQGRALWKELGRDANEEALPLARRGAAEITGISDSGADTKQVEFSYKWEPTELGKAFDPDEAAFKKLPANLQEALKKIQRGTFGTGKNNVAQFDSVKKGVAHFQKYDDGWRIYQLYFM